MGTELRTLRHNNCSQMFQACRLPGVAHAGNRNAADQPCSNPEDSSKPLRSCLAVTPEIPLGRSSSRRVMIKTSTRETQVKLTVSVPPSLHVLLRGWALCEGRELTSVVLQCVELSVRQLKSNGSIPSAAIRAYEAACDERLAVGGL